MSGPHFFNSSPISEKLAKKWGISVRELDALDGDQDFTISLNPITTDPKIGYKIVHPKPEDSRVDKHVTSLVVKEEGHAFCKDVYVFGNGDARITEGDLFVCNDIHNIARPAGYEDYLYEVVEQGGIEAHLRYFALGVKMLEQGNLGQAEKYLKLSINKKQADYEEFDTVATLEAKDGKRSFCLYVDMPPLSSNAKHTKYAEAYYMLGNVYKRVSSWMSRSSANFCYDRAIKLNPTFAEAYKNRGFVEFGEKAMADLKKAIELNPKFADDPEVQKKIRLLEWWNKRTAELKIEKTATPAIAPSATQPLEVPSSTPAAAPPPPSGWGCSVSAVGAGSSGSLTAWIKSVWSYLFD